jgi:hypothetical protein
MIAQTTNGCNSGSYDDSGDQTGSHSGNYIIKSIAYAISIFVFTSTMMKLN